MATSYKGLTVKFGADTQALSTALRKINTEAKKTTSDLKEIDKALKIDPKNTELLTQKQNALQRALGETADKTKVYKSALDDLAKKEQTQGQLTAEQQRQYESIQRNIITAKAAHDDYQRELEETEQALRDVADAAGRMDAAVEDSSKNTRDAAEDTGRTRTASERLSSAGSALQDVGTGMVVAGHGIQTAIGDPLLALGRDAVDVSREFSNTMAQVRGALGATDEDMASLTDTAMELGAASVFSAGDAAEAMLELAKAGMSPATIQAGALQAAMDLAAAGELSMGDAASYIVQTMSTFDLRAEDAAGIADALAGSANATIDSVEGVAGALGNVGAIASEVGWGMSDTVSAISMLQQNGMGGAEAGTALRSVLKQLISPSKAAREAMEMYGINVRDANGQLKDAASLAEEFSNALAGVSDEERDAALAAIGGSYGMQALALMYRDGAAGIATYYDAVTDGQAAEQMAQASLGEMGWAFEQLDGSIETAKIAIGEALAPVLVDLAKSVTELVDWFTSLDDGTQELIVKAGLFAVVVGPVLSGLGGIASGVGGIMQIGGMMAGAGGLGGMMGLSGVASGASAGAAGLASVASVAGVALPLALAAAAGAAIGLGITWLATTEDGQAAWQGFCDFVGGAWDSVCKGVEDAMQALADFFAGIWQGIQDAWSWVSDQFTGNTYVSNTSPLNGGSIPGLASGALVTGPTLALIGEGRGAEYVEPRNSIVQDMAAALRIAGRGQQGGLVLNVTVQSDGSGNPQRMGESIARATASVLKQRGVAYA